jgi:hypothetical protein
VDEWSRDSLVAKARYFCEVTAEPVQGIRGLRLSIGLEMLLRAVLADVHPALLADPTGDAIMAAFEVSGGADHVAKSIQSKTVLQRCERIIGVTFKDVLKDAEKIFNLRNADLHSGALPFDDMRRDEWLPSLYRVAEVACATLGEDIDSILPKDVLTEAKLLDARRQERVVKEVADALRAASELAAKLKPEERIAREAWVLTSQHHVSCPGCGTEIPLEVESLRTTRTLDEDQGIVWTRIEKLATGLRCGVCELELTTPAHLRAAHIETMITLDSDVSLDDYVSSIYEQDFEPDYGND